MQTRHPLTRSPACDVATSSSHRQPANPPPVGIERLMADAIDAIARNLPGQPADPGAIEYASWLRQLRRSSP